MTARGRLRFTRDDVCGNGHSMFDALVVRIDDKGPVLKCRPCTLAAGRRHRGTDGPRKNGHRQRSTIDWNAVDEAWDIEPRLDPILHIHDIDGDRWAVIERVDGSRIVTRTEQPNRWRVGAVDWHEVPRPTR